MDSIRFENVSKSFGKTKIINNLNLSIEKGERLILLGPSGCGKTTLIRCLLGFNKPSTGEIWIGDRWTAGTGISPWCSRTTPCIPT